MFANIEDVFEAIRAGDLDEHLVNLIDTAKSRQVAVPLKVGDQVVVNDNCSPKYMQGIRGEIKSVTGKRQRGNPVYLVKIDQSEAFKLAGTKMTRYNYSTGEYTVLDISMARDLIKKV